MALQDSLYDIIGSIAADKYFNYSSPTGVIGMPLSDGLGDLRIDENNLFISSDSNEIRFMMGISTWGATAEGRADLVGE